MSVCAHPCETVDLGAPKYTYLCVDVCVDIQTLHPSQGLSREFQVQVSGWLAKLVRVRATSESSPHSAPVLGR